MDIVNIYGVAVFLIIICLSVYGLCQRKTGGVFKAFTLSTLILAVFLLYFNHIKTDHLYSVFTIYIGLLFFFLGNFFTQSFRKKVAKLFTSNPSFYNFKLRWRIGYLSMLIGTIFIGISFLDFHHHYLFLVLTVTF